MIKPYSIKSLFLISILNIVGSLSILTVFSEEITPMKAADSISMIAIIANPKKFHKTPIRIRGFFVYDKQDNYAEIYLNRVSAEYDIRKDAFVCIIDLEKFSEKQLLQKSMSMVLVEGVFYEDQKGEHHLNSEGIYSIHRIEKLKKRETR